MKELSPSEIAAAIRSAFHAVGRGRITLHEAEAIDDYRSPAQRAKARRADIETAWEAIPGEHIEECNNALPYLDAESWRYYLPRFMQWTLEHFEQSSNIATDATIYTLLLGDDRTLNAHARRRYEMLTREQSRVVCAFLTYMSGHEAHCDSESAAQALERFWGKFKSEA